MLGTLVEIHAVMVGRATEDLNAAVEAAFVVVDRVHKLMSYHDLTSDVSRINGAQVGTETRIDARTYEVLQAARNYSEASDGLFDITVAPQLCRLGFLPDHSSFPACDEHGNWRSIELLPGCTIRKRGHVRIDLGGIAKGYAVDCAIQALKLAGVTVAQVNAGGDLRFYDTAARAIHVRHPVTPGCRVLVAEAHEGAVATSAAYYANRQINGHCVSPHIHPNTREARKAGDSVSVIAPDCMTADALTKIVMSGDAECTETVLEKYAAHAIVLQGDPDGRVARPNSDRRAA